MMDIKEWMPEAIDYKQSRGRCGTGYVSLKARILGTVGRTLLIGKK